MARRSLALYRSALAGSPEPGPGGDPPEADAAADLALLVPSRNEPLA